MLTEAEGHIAYSEAMRARGILDLCHAVAILSQVIKMLCLCTASLVKRTRLAVPKQSFLNLLRQNGRRVTKVYCFSKIQLVG